VTKQSGLDAKVDESFFLLTAGSGDLVADLFEEGEPLDHNGVGAELLCRG
jgi:hypothetical protein